MAVVASEEVVVEEDLVAEEEEEEAEGEVIVEVDVAVLEVMKRIYRPKKVALYSALYSK